MAASESRKHEDPRIYSFSVVKCRTPELQNLQDGFSDGFSHSLQCFQERHSTGSVSIRPTGDGGETEGRRRGDGGGDDPAVQRGSVSCNGTPCCSPSPAVRVCSCQQSPTNTPPQSAACSG